MQQQSRISNDRRLCCVWILLVCLWLDMSHAATPEDVSNEEPKQQNVGSSFMESLWAWIGSITERYGAWTMGLAVVISDSIPLLPTEPIAIVAGAVFGIRVGLPAVMAGQALATLFAILVGRYVLSRRRGGGWREQSCTDDDDDDRQQQAQCENNSNTKLSRLLEELTTGLNSDNWKILFGTVILARQSPILPFSLGNYFIGASTSAPVLPVVLATIIGCLPLNCLWVGAGAGGTAAVQLALDHPGAGRWAMAMEIVGLVATSAIVGFCFRVICKVWKEEDDDDDALCDVDRDGRSLDVDDEAPLVSPGFYSSCLGS